MFDIRRLKVEDDTLFDSEDGAMAYVNEEIDHALEKHGTGAFVSTHEILGVLDEEFEEFKRAIHKNDIDACMDELAQVAQVAIFGIASILQARKDAR